MAAAAIYAAIQYISWFEGSHVQKIANNIQKVSHQFPVLHTEAKVHFLSQSKIIRASQLFTAAPNVLQQQRKQLKRAQLQKNKRRNSLFPHTTWALLFFCNRAAPGPRHLRLFFRFHNPRVNNLAPPTLSPGRMIAAYL